jgi:WD40 repeat protein
MRYKDTEGGISRTLAFSPDGQFLTFVSNGRLQFSSPSNGKLLGDFDINPTSLTLHPSGLLLATVSLHDRAIQLWQIRY